jgi:alkanesulfonate monooxygenase SsuD/methylene tetrahydromethanopterin reductase-like flavin-dependent oxidoreductase (luciferase family)
VDEDTRRAKEQVRPLIALYLSVFPNIARETELSPDFVARTRETFQSEGLMRAASLITDEMVDSLVVAGTAAECRARIQAYRDAGLQLPILFPVDGNYAAALEQLAPGK